MSLQSELTRLQANVTSITSSKDAIMTALASKGVTVPTGATLHDVPNLISQINGMGPIGYVAIGGRTYKTVKIGTQEWLAENLDYKFDVNGSQIPVGLDNFPSTPAAWYYNNNEVDYGIDGTYKCGLLYNWYAAKYLDDNKSTLLPEDWRVPSKSDYEFLFNYISTDVCVNMKSTDNSVIPGFPIGWNGTNLSGYDALPSGWHRTDSGFDGFQSHFTTWTTSSNYDGGWFFDLDTGGGDPWSMYGLSVQGIALRLVKDIT